YTRDAATPGTCQAQTYSAGQSCTVIVDFQQTAIGPRAGAVVLFDANNKALQTQFLSETGTGALTTLDTAPASDPVQPAFDNTTLQLSPLQLALDPAGDMFIADLHGNDAVELKPSSSGALDPSTATILGANINNWGLPIEGLTVDGAGNLYLLYPDAVYEIPNENGTLNSADFTTVAQVDILSGHWLTGIASDGQGDVYVADLFAGLFKIAPGSTQLQQIASDVLPYSAFLVTADAAGNLFASDGVCNVFKIPASGSDSKVVPGPGPGSLLCFSGLGSDAAGNLLLASALDGQIYEIATDGSQTVIAQAPSGHLVFAPLLDSSANVYYDDYQHTGGLLSGQSVNVVEKVGRNAPSVIFGSVNPGSPNSQVSITVGNAGNENLQISSLQLGGSDPSAFSFQAAASNGCSTTTPVNPGSDCAFLAVFTPNIPGAASATETITDNTSQSPHVLPLSGNGNGVNSAAQVAFTSTLPTGLTAPAPLGSVTVQVEDASGNVITSSDSISVTISGDGQTATVTGTAGQAINLNTTLPDGGTYTVTAADTTETNLASANATIAVAAPSIPVGQSSSSGQSGNGGVVQIADFSFGTASETISAINVTTFGASGQEFTRDASDTGLGACAVGTSYQNSSCTVMVDFKPSAPGVRMGAVTLITSTGKHTIYLSRTATAPLLTADVPSPAPTVIANGVDAASLALDGSGDLYIADATHGSVVEQLNPAQCSSNCQVQVASGSWTRPTSVAVDGAGNLYVADSGNGLVEGLASGTTNLVTLEHFGANTTPIADAVTGGGLVYASNNTAQSITAACALNAACNAPATVAGLGANLTSIVVDASGNRFFPVSGSVEKLAAGTSSPSVVAAGFTGPLSLALDAAGDVYVLDSGAGNLVEIFPSGAKTLLVSGLQPGTSLAGLAVDSFGNIYYANLAANQVVEIERSSTTSLPIATLPISTTYGTAGQGTFSVSNSGNATLSLSGVTVTGTGFSQNTGASTCGASLASGAACTVGITLAGTVPAGSDAGAAALSDNSLNASAASQQITLSGSVAKATLTLSANNATMAAGASALPTFTGTMAGQVNSDSLTETFSTNATLSSPPGTYTITVSATGAHIADYSISATTATLTVTSGNQTITFNPPATLTYGASIT
ncbi:MAG: choice-of-anchor D domain-containing protein, partial [Terriglobales bacterium]